MYTLKDLSVITGLTDRTLRTYIKMGILQGEKTDGVWSFSDEQIQMFFENNFARSAMQSKRNSLVFDFLADQKKKEKRMCVILDLPEDNHHSVRTFICEAVNRGTDLKMFYSKQRSGCRIILEGAEDSVFRIMQEFHEKF